MKSRPASQIFILTVAFMGAFDCEAAGTLFSQYVMTPTAAELGRYGHGHMTGSLQRTSDGQGILYAYAYDDYGRASKSSALSTNGCLSITGYLYNFVGDVTEENGLIYQIQADGSAAKVLDYQAKTEYNGAHSQLPTHTSLTIARQDASPMSGDTIIVSHPAYDDLGHVVNNDRSGTAADMTYSYDNLHGWMTGIQSAGGFEQTLYREDNTTNPLYNGSISAMKWHVPGELYDRKYAYTYDGLNRLTEATYSQSARVETAAGGVTSNVTDAVSAGTASNAVGLSKIATVTTSGLSLVPSTDLELTLSDVSASETQTSTTASSISSNASSLVLAQNHYGEKICYDRNSNILTLQRRGMLDTKKYGLIDDLEINYNGNQRTAVTDNAGSLSYDNASDFVDGADETEEYSYDANGALTKDLNRGIDTVEYDLLGNPKKISFSDDKSIEYVYSADGVKLRETHISPMLVLGSTSRATATVSKKTLYKKDVTDYIGNLILKNGHPESLQFDGGYVSFDADTISGIHYYIQDYMGNNRMVVNGLTDSIEQITHYYPYGGVIGDISTNESLQKFKFEGKELDRSFGLDNYDIQARSYFAMAPMWDRVDPLSEKYYGISPYVYCGGDPVNLGDYDGQSIYEINYETGKIECVFVNHDPYDIIQRKLDNGQYVKSEKIYDQKLVEEFANCNEGESRNYTSNDESSAHAFYEFVAENSSMEWSIAELKSVKGKAVDKPTYQIGTSNDHHKVSIGIGEAGDNNVNTNIYWDDIKWQMHSHPSYDDGTPITRGPSEKDKNFAYSCDRHIRTSMPNLYVYNTKYHELYSYTASSSKLLKNKTRIPWKIIR